MGYIDLEHYFLDGTKVEANAKRYSFVWRKSTETYQANLQKKVRTLLDEIDSTKLKEAVKKINEALKKNQKNKKLKKAKRKLEKDFLPRQEKYESYRATFRGRNSFSKTDKDATFMRMKEDHMGNGQLKPAYNLQLATCKQFILNYTIEQTTTDTTTLIHHLDEFENLYGQYPEVVTADAGYGSEENYEHLENNEIEAFVKYNYFHKEQTKKWKENPYRQDNLYYNSEKDCFFCPMGQKMKNMGKISRRTSTGYKQTYTLYQAQNCQGCPLRGACHKQKSNRIIEVNHKLRKHKAKARELLMSEKGMEKRSQRPADVEATFGIIKQNKGFRRFILRGSENVEVETGLIAIAHNIAKMCA